MDSDKHEVAERLASHLEAAHTARDTQRQRPEHLAARDRLRSWQAERLAKTHADLLASDRYGDAARFFKTDIYAAKDFGDRDAALARVLPLLTRFLPLSALETVCRAVELDALSESLDADMVKALAGSGAGDSIDEDSYARAYRKVGRKADREHQIVLVRAIGEPLDELTRHPMLRNTLAMMGTPARALGMGALHAFLMAGFNAFSRMQGADYFLATIESRERALSRRLFADEKDPFRR